MASAVAIAGVAMVATAGCDPIAGKDRSIYLMGDSLMASASWEFDGWQQRAPAGYDVRTEAFGGKTIPDHLEQMVQYGRDDVPERAVIELGTNDARIDGWTAQDVAAYQRLVNAVPARTCIVYVLPAATGGASVATRSSVAAAASAIRSIAEADDRRQIADFGDFIAAHPDMIQSDGIHLVDGPVAGQARSDIRAAYRDWLWDFVNRCRGGRRSG